jgi:hypothetical protein
VVLALNNAFSVGDRRRAFFLTARSTKGKQLSSIMRLFLSDDFQRSLRTATRLLVAATQAESKLLGMNLFDRALIHCQNVSTLRARARSMMGLACASQKSFRQIG